MVMTEKLSSCINPDTSNGLVEKYNISVGKETNSIDHQFNERGTPKMFSLYTEFFRTLLMGRSSALSPVPSHPNMVLTPFITFSQKFTPHTHSLLVRSNSVAPEPNLANNPLCSETNIYFRKTPAQMDAPF